MKLTINTLNLRGLSLIFVVLNSCFCDRDIQSLRSELDKNISIWESNDLKHYQYTIKRDSDLKYTKISIYYGQAYSAIFFDGTNHIESLNNLFINKDPIDALFVYIRGSLIEALNTCHSIDHEFNLMNITEIRYHPEYGYPIYFRQKDRTRLHWFEITHFKILK